MMWRAADGPQVARSPGPSGTEAASARRKAGGPGGGTVSLALAARLAEAPRAGRAAVPGSARPGDHAARPRLGGHHRRVRGDLPARDRRPGRLVLDPGGHAARGCLSRSAPSRRSCSEPGLVPAMLQWYYCVAAVYSLLMTGWRAAIIGPLAGVCYLVQVLLGSAPVPLAVALLRSGRARGPRAGHVPRRPCLPAGPVGRRAHRHSRRADRPAQQGQLPRRRRGRDGRRYVDVHRAGLRRRPVQERQRRARSCDR